MLYQKCGDVSDGKAQLIDFIENLKQNKSLNPSTLVPEFVSVSPIDGPRLWLRIAAEYLQGESDDHDDPVDKAIEACSKALENATEHSPKLKVACHYTMLRIYRDLRYANKTGKIFVEQMANDGDYRERQDHLTLFDQRILSKWTRDFIDEYNERRSIHQGDEIPRTLADKFFVPELSEAMNEDNDSQKCLGDTLISLSDYQGAIAYWEWILSECESFYTKSVRRLIYDDNTTVGQVFDEIQQLQENAGEYISRLMIGCEQLANYTIKAGAQQDVSAEEAVCYFENAVQQCKRALRLNTELHHGKDQEETDLQQLHKDIENKLEEANKKFEQEINENGDSDDDDSNDDETYDDSN